MMHGHMVAGGISYLSIVLLSFAPLGVGCGSMSSPISSSSTSPVQASAQFLYVTGEVSGDRTQLFGYRIQKDGTLDQLELPGLIAPYCCHQATSADSVLYVADFGGGVAAMSVDPQGGQLTPLPDSPFQGLTSSAIGSPTACGDKFLFVTNGFPGGVFAFAINSSGGLNLVSGSPFPTGTSPGQPVVDPSCRFLFVTNSYDGSAKQNGGIIYAYTLDAVTGKLSSVSGSPFSFGSSTSIARSPTTDTTGSFLYVPNPDAQTISGFSIDPTGVLVPLTGSPFTAGGNPFFALAASVMSKQFLYVGTGSDAISAFAIDNNTGQLRFISNFATTSQPSFLVSSETFLYSFNIISGKVSSNNVDVFSVNQDGTLSSISMAGTLGYFPTSATVVTTGITKSSDQMVLNARE